MRGSARTVSIVLLVLYVVFLGAVLTEYNPQVATGVVGRMEHWLDAHGSPSWVTGPGRVEFSLNAAMFTPIAFLACLSFPRHHWATWVVYAFVGSSATELFQGLVLPPRSAEFVDIVANTLGALVGAVVAALVTRGRSGTHKARTKG